MPDYLIDNLPLSIVTINRTSKETNQYHFKIITINKNDEECHFFSPQKSYNIFLLESTHSLMFYIFTDIFINSILEKRFFDG